MKLEKFIDLQMHTIFSDGQFTPERIVKEAKKRNIKIISITDHNGINGVEKAQKAAKKHGLKNIPAIEIYTTFKNKNFHILGYGIDIKNKLLNKTLLKLRLNRLEKVKKSVRKLNRIGFKISEEKLLKVNTDYLSTGHIISLLGKFKKNREKIARDLKNKNISSPQIVAFYLIKGKSAYLPEESMSAQKAIELIKKAGGIPVLAHPGQHLSWDEDKYIYLLKKMGLKGIEAISSHHTWYQIEHYQIVAKNLNLFITGGSDFHGELTTVDNYYIKNPLDYFRVPYYIINNLKKHIRL